MRDRLLSALLVLCTALSLLPTARAVDDVFPDEAQQTDLSGWAAEAAAAASSRTGRWGAVELDGEIIGEVDLDPPVDWFEQMSVPTLAAENKYTGQVQLKNSNEVRWIDRVVLPDYAINLYNILEEAADGDGYNDYLIDDRYFDLSGNFDGSYVGEPGDYMRLKFSNSYYAAILVTAVETGLVTDDLRAYISDCSYTVRCAFMMDHPGVFWMSGLSSTSYNWAGKTYFLCILSYDWTSGTETRTFDARRPVFQPGGGWNIREQMNRRDAAVENILSTIPYGADRYTQVYCINNWLTENNQYNTLVSSGEKGPWYANTCLSALTGSKGVDGPVCQGFAVAFKILCDTLGIPCVSVRGDVWYSPTRLAGYHEWNYLQMEDGKWYAIDVTWNSKPDSTKWFLLGSKTIADEMDFLMSHPAENWFSSTGLWFTNGPVLSETAYGPLLRYSGMPDSLSVGDSVDLMASLTRLRDGADYRYSVQPVLPSGLTLDPDTGRITGTASAIAEAADVKVTAANPYDRTDFATYILKFPAVGASIRTVTFNANGGTLSGGTTATTDAYGRLTRLPNPNARTGYTFTGWYTESAGGTLVTADTMFTADMTIYAHWVSDSSASSGTCGRSMNWSYSNGVLTISGSGDMTTYGNPDDNGTPPPWYDRHEQIHTIQINDGVTSVGWYAFYGCTNLTSVTLPASMSKIATYAFRKCSSLESVNIPAGVTSIGFGAFLDCSSLKSVTIPSGVTSIETYTFNGCSSLRSVVIPDSVRSIGSSAFYACSSLKSVTIPNGVSSIESSTFNGCSSLERVDIPSSVRSIGPLVFRDCSSLKSVTIPDGVTSIESSTFWGCGSLRSVTIPDSVTSIGYAAFYECDSLRDVYYSGSPAQWKAIGVDKFNSSLTKVTPRYSSPFLDRSSQTVYVNLQEQTGSLAVCAAYGPGGQLADVAVKPVSTGTISLKFSRQLPDNCTVTLMLVDSTTWRPLREASAVPEL